MLMTIAVDKHLYVQKMYVPESVAAQLMDLLNTPTQDIRQAVMSFAYPLIGEGCDASTRSKALIRDTVLSDVRLSYRKLLAPNTSSPMVKCLSLNLDFVAPNTEEILYELMKALYVIQYLELHRIALSISVPSHSAESSCLMLKLGLELVQPAVSGPEFIGQYNRYVITDRGLLNKFHTDVTAIK